MIFIRNVVATIFFALCLFGHKAAWAADWISAGGNVSFGASPVCALVLINGQSQFSCDGSGRYDMQVPVDDNGMITVMVFADGFAPFNQIISPAQATEYPIQILLDQQSPLFQVDAMYESSADEGRFIVSGTIFVGNVPVCALVLANGQSMFSCNENQGQFSLDVPLDQDGNVTLMVFAAGFKPYKLITNVVQDSDQDGIRDYLDYDDDNDCIFDIDDACPQVFGSECKVITDTITAAGKVWAQVALFTELSWDDINAVCPGIYISRDEDGNHTTEQNGSGVCQGTLNGYDMSGWTWADSAEISALFNHYGVVPPFSPEAFDDYGRLIPGTGNRSVWDEHYGPEIYDVADTFFHAGWWPMEFYPLFVQPWDAHVYGRLRTKSTSWVWDIRTARNVPTESNDTARVGINYDHKYQDAEYKAMFAVREGISTAMTKNYGAWFFRSP